MPKYYCDYCDIFLTHDSSSVRKSHNTGWKHKMHVQNYYSELSQERVQEIINIITFAYRGYSGLPDFAPMPPRGMPYGITPRPPVGMPPMGGPMGGPPGPPPPFMGGRPPFPPPPGFRPPAPGSLPFPPPGDASSQKRPYDDRADNQDGSKRSRY